MIYIVGYYSGRWNITWKMFKKSSLLCILHLNNFGSFKWKTLFGTALLLLCRSFSIFDSFSYNFFNILCHGLSRFSKKDDFIDFNKNVWCSTIFRMGLNNSNATISCIVNHCLIHFHKIVRCSGIYSKLIRILFFALFPNI